MLLRAPDDCLHKRVWHFFKIFPKIEFEFCTKVALKAAYNDQRFTNFDSVAYFAALFVSRRFDLSSQLGYRRDVPWANQTDLAKAFGKIPQDLYEA